MKKLLSIILALAVLLSMNVVALADQTHEITSAEYPLYVGTISLDFNVKCYFLDGAEDLPYVEANDWLVMLNEIVGSTKNGISFTMEADGPAVTYTRRNANANADDNGIVLRTKGTKKQAPETLHLAYSDIKTARVVLKF